MNVETSSSSSFDGAADKIVIISILLCVLVIMVITIIIVVKIHFHSQQQRTENLMEAKMSIMALVQSSEIMNTLPTIENAASGKRGLLDLQMNKDFKILSVFKEGSIFSLHKGILLGKSATEIAIKIFHANHEKSFDLELSIISRLKKHQNILEFIGYTSLEANAMLISKFYHSNTVSRNLNTISSSIDVVVKVAFDVVNALLHLHEQDILYLAINSDSIVLDLKSDNSFNCLLCDLGNASRIGKIGGLYCLKGGKGDCELNVKYAAPEIISKLRNDKNGCSTVNQQADKKLDIFAYAILIFEMLYGSELWKKWNDQTDQNVADRILGGERPNVFLPNHHEIYENQPINTIVEACWSQDPERRFEAANIVNILQLDVNHTTKLKTHSTNLYPQKEQ